VSRCSRLRYGARDIGVFGTVKSDGHQFILDVGNEISLMDDETDYGTSIFGPNASKFSPASSSLLKNRPSSIA
jgi:hypothetical protein